MEMNYSSVETVQLSCCYVNNLETIASEKYRPRKIGLFTNIWVGEAAKSLIEQLKLWFCWFLSEPTSSWFNHLETSFPPNISCIRLHLQRPETEKDQLAEVNRIPVV